MGRPVGAAGWRYAIIRPITPLSLAIAALALAGCSSRDAPADIGVCWRMTQVQGAKPQFTPLNNEVDSLDDCAVQLEALHLQGAKTVLGAFQGYFIFVDDKEVTSSPHMKSRFRYPVFQPSQRSVIDADLRGLLKDHKGKLSPKDDLSLRRN